MVHNVFIVPADHLLQVYFDALSTAAYLFLEHRLQHT